MDRRSFVQKAAAGLVAAALAPASLFAVPTEFTLHRQVPCFDGLCQTWQPVEWWDLLPADIVKTGSGRLWQINSLPFLNDQGIDAVMADDIPA